MRHKGTSFPEQAIFYYLRKEYPNTVNGYTEIFETFKTELDIFIPEIKTAIEYDGTAWHSNKRSQTRDKRKYEKCAENNIRLIRVSEHDEESNQFCDTLIRRIDLSRDTLDDTIREVLLASHVTVADVDTIRDRNSIMRQYITVIKDKSIAAKYPEAVKEWDIEKNGGLTADMVTALSQERYWWRCEFGHSYQSTPANKLPYGYGCPFCSGHRLLKGFNDLNTKYPEVAKEWDYEKNSPITPSDIYYGTNRKYWWICHNGHSYQARPQARTHLKAGCPICSNHEVLPGYNDLATTYPSIAQYWDYEKNGDLSPNMVTPGSNKKVWWKCQKGHSFEKTISLQTVSESCPICGFRVLLQGFNDLATTHPALANEWNYSKNELLLPSSVMKTSTKKVWWRCLTCGTEWKAQINLRVLSKTGCPKCGYSVKMQLTRARRIKEQNKDLVSLFPEIAAEWDYERNEGLDPTALSPGCNKKVWWICSKGHHYQAWMNDRTGKHKTGCPYCAGKRKLSKLEE